MINKRITSFIGLLLAACVLFGCSATEPSQTSDVTVETTTEYETTGETGVQTQTDAQTTDYISTEKVYKMADFQFTAEERKKADEFADAQSGLLAKYFMDEAGQKQIASKRVDGKSIEISDQRIVKLVKLSGFICFADDGKHKISFSDNVTQTVVIGKGDLHLSVYNGRFKFEAGVYYEFSADLRIKEPAENITITLNCEGSDFGVYLCRPLTGGAIPENTSPMLELPMRDTQIISADNAYYMTGTFGPDFWDNSYEIHVYKSTDLVNWEDLGAVWNYDNDSIWGKKVANDTRRPVWAPEIHKIKDDWYICYSLGFWGAFCGGLLKSTTGNPEGPYTDVTDKKIVDYIDSSMFEDTDGSVYFLYSDGLIAKMNDEMNGFAEKFKPLYASDGMPVGFEGCYIFKINGLYYLTSSLYNTYINQDGKLVTSYDCVYAVSDNIYGPYSERRLLMRGGGHGSLFFDNEGNLYLSHFITWCKPSVTKLSIDDKGILSVE